MLLVGDDIQGVLCGTPNLGTSVLKKQDEYF
jgi:hypothetical protein